MSSHATLLKLEQHQVMTIPTAQAIQHDDGEGSEQTEPNNITLAVRNDDRHRQQRAEDGAGIATDLKNELR